MADIGVLPNHGEIEPASMAQIRQGKDGKFVEITEDVANVARDIAEIDSRLRVRYSEAGEYFVIYAREDWQEPGDGYLVTTAQELDQRLVERIKRISHESYKFADEVDRQDQVEDARHEQRHKDQIGDYAERLAHALRKERGLDKGRVFID